MRKLLRENLGQSRVNLFRNPLPIKKKENIGEELSDTQQKILILLSKDAQLSASKMADQIGVARRNIEAGNSDSSWLSEKWILGNRI